MSAPDIASELVRELEVAETKAWDALARYKFQMFGYWAAIWVHLNRIGDFRRPNPWAALVASARVQRAGPRAPLPLFDGEPT
jgi:hypothetical protein